MLVEPRIQALSAPFMTGVQRCCASMVPKEGAIGVDLAHPEHRPCHTGVYAARVPELARGRLNPEHVFQCPETA